MITQEHFNLLCSTFYKQYIKVKNDVGRTEKLPEMLTAPIAKAVSSVPGMACRKGCSHCCYLRVVCFPHEIVAIYMYLNRILDKKRLQEIKGKITKQYELIKNFTIDEHFTTNVECPLLENNSAIEKWL